MRGNDQRPGVVFSCVVDGDPNSARSARRAHWSNPFCGPGPQARNQTASTPDPVRMIVKNEIVGVTPFLHTC